MNHESTAPQTAVPILVELPASLDLALQQHHNLRQAVCQEITRKLSDLLDILGLPGSPSVSLISPPTGVPSPEAILRLRVHGRVCHYPDELTQKVYHYLKGLPLGPTVKIAAILAWLQELAEPSAAPDSADLVDFLALLCLEIIKTQPAVLLGQPQLESYLDRLFPANAADANPNWPPDRDWLWSALARVLNLRLSLAAAPMVSQIVRAAWEQNRSWEDAAEELIVALRPNIVEIQLPLPYLQALTSHSLYGADVFTLNRYALFLSTGLRFPDFRFVPVENLQPHSFAFKINHLPTTPRIGLTPGHYLINVNVHRLADFKFTGHPAVNPVDHSEWSLVASDADPAPDHAGLSRWDPLGYLSLSLRADLLEHSAGFLDRGLVRGYLDKLAQVFPDLVAAARESFCLEVVTRVLRSLAVERLSIRNLPAILNALLAADYLVVDLFASSAFDGRLVLLQQPESGWRQNDYYLTAYVRQCLKDQIGYQFSQGASYVRIIQLDPEIEKLLAPLAAVAAGGLAQTTLPETVVNQILTAVQQEISKLVDTAPDYPLPAIITIGPLRPVLRHILAPRFPRLPVVAYQELPANLNLQTITTITLGS